MSLISKNPGVQVLRDQGNAGGQRAGGQQLWWWTDSGFTELIRPATAGRTPFDKSPMLGMCAAHSRPYLADF